MRGSDESCLLGFQRRELRQQQLGASYVDDLCSLSDSSFDSEAEDGALLLAATVSSLLSSPKTDAPTQEHENVQRVTQSHW